MPAKKLKRKPNCINITLAVDPATGVSSPMGVAAFEGESKTILWTLALGASDKSKEHRRKRLSEVVALIAELYEERTNVYFFIETFVMRGKGGETLQRLIGAVTAALPPTIPVEYVHNTKLKQQISGNGHASKREVADGVLGWFASNPASAAYVRNLISLRRWDETDALAIGIIGFLTHVSK